MTPDAPRTEDDDLAGAFHEAMTLRAWPCPGQHAIGEGHCQNLAALVAMDDHLRVVLGDELAEATPADSLDALWDAAQRLVDSWFTGEPTGWHGEYEFRQAVDDLRAALQAGQQSPEGGES